MTAAYESDEAFERLMDDLQVVLGAKAGQVLTQDDVDALQRLERHWSEDGERATDAYARGYRDALHSAGGDALVKADERTAAADVEAVTLRALGKFAEARIAELEAFIAKPPRHDWWGAGDPDCPKDIKAGNGELHTMRCKRCGQDNPRDDFCRATITKSQPDQMTGEG